MPGGRRRSSHPGEKGMLEGQEGCVWTCVCVCAAQFCPGQGEKLQMRSAPCSVQAKMLAGFTPGSRVTPPAPAPGCVFTPLPYSRGK